MSGESSWEKRASSFLSAIAVVGGLASTLYQIAKIDKQDVKQEALVLSAITVQNKELASLRADVESLRDENTRLHGALSQPRDARAEAMQREAELRRLAEDRMAELQRREEMEKIEKIEKLRAELKSKMMPVVPLSTGDEEPAESESPVEIEKPVEEVPPAESVGAMPPTFDEMRAQADQGKVWSNGSWVDYK